MSGKKCVWRYDFRNEIWVSDCGLLWYMSNEDTPKENEMNYCAKCGRELVEEIKE